MTTKTKNPSLQAQLKAANAAAAEHKAHAENVQKALDSAWSPNTNCNSRA